MNSIDRTSPVPYYEQLFIILRDRIESGAIAVDEKLPSEMELSRDFELSRATVRQTMSRLEAEGLAQRIARRGMFATAPYASSGWTVEQGFLESQVRNGRNDISTVVVNAQLVLPPQHVARALRLSPDTDIFALERVRSLNDQVGMFSTNWFPPAVAKLIVGFPDVLDGTGSVNDRLSRLGFSANRAHRVIHALGAPMAVAARLGVNTGVPILRVRSLTWDAEEVPFDYYETWVLTDVIPLEVEVAAR